jgi:hypothetical protein
MSFSTSYAACWLQRDENVDVAVVIAVTGSRAADGDDSNLACEMGLDRRKPRKVAVQETEFVFDVRVTRGVRVLGPDLCGRRLTGGLHDNRRRRRSSRAASATPPQGQGKRDNRGALTFPTPHEPSQLADGGIRNAIAAAEHHGR